LGPNKKKLKSMTKLNWHKRIKGKIKNKKKCMALAFHMPMCEVIEIWATRVVSSVNRWWSFFVLPKSSLRVLSPKMVCVGDQLPTWLQWPPPLHFPPCLEIRVAAATTKTLVNHSVLCVCVCTRALSAFYCSYP
jgi:hypothetical protein